MMYLRVKEEMMQQKEGTTTTKAKTGKRKWLSRLGNFMLMGGFLLVLVLGVAIAITISILFKGC